MLIEEGYAYDASIFPIRHDRYGIPDAPRQPHRISRARRLAPRSARPTARSSGSLALPIGGGYFRLFPYALTRWAIRQVNQQTGQPAIFYIHPVGDSIPTSRGSPRSLVTRCRHYNQLGATEDRLRRLLRDFRVRVD